MYRYIPRFFRAQKVTKNLGQCVFARAALMVFRRETNSKLKLDIDKKEFSELLLIANEPEEVPLSVYFLDFCDFSKNASIKFFLI